MSVCSSPRRAPAGLCFEYVGEEMGNVREYSATDQREEGNKQMVKEISVFQLPFHRRVNWARSESSEVRSCVLCVREALSPPRTRSKFLGKKRREEMKKKIKTLLHSNSQMRSRVSET